MAKMMWTLSLLILISIGGALSNKCGENVREECDLGLLPRSFPESAEEMMTMCQNFQAFGNCAIDVMDKCETLDTTDTERLAEVRKIVRYLSSMCVEDNPTFKALSTNLECIKPSLFTTDPSSSCTSIITDENVDRLNEHLWPLYEVYKDELVQCLEALTEIKCPAVTLGYKCGEGVQEAVEDVLFQVGEARAKACTPEYLEELEPFMEVFESILLEELELQDELEKRK